LGGGEEDSGPLTGVVRVAAVVGGHERGCLDLVATGLHGAGFRSRGDDNE
jgi:hypothetical protein